MTKEQEKYIQAQYREGFCLPDKIMKRVWAAQLVMYEEIRKIFDDNDITYWAGFGTMLGAVRHHGYIPWDDDLDLWIERESYDKIMAPEFLDKFRALGYKWVNIHTDHNYDSLLTRMCNCGEPTFTDKHLDKYCGCPYVLGIDFFPLDYLPNKEEKYDTLCILLKTIESVAQKWPDESKRSDCLKSIEIIEKFTKIKVDTNGHVPYQMRLAMETIGRQFKKETSNSIGLLPLQPNIPHKWQYNKEWFEDYYIMDYENTNIRVPVGYDEILSKTYSPEWRTPKRYFVHSYPYYTIQNNVIQSRIDMRTEKLADIKVKKQRTKERREIDKMKKFLVDYAPKPKEEKKTVETD